jgi:hypothetical protein
MIGTDNEKGATKHRSLVLRVSQWKQTDDMYRGLGLRFPNHPTNCSKGLPSRSNTTFELHRSVACFLSLLI